MALNQGYVYREILGSHPGKSALTYLAERYRHSTLEAWATRFARGEIRLNGVTASGPEPLVAGQELAWHRPPWDEADTPQTFEVAFEDEHLLAVVKPSGLPTLPSGGYFQNTLLSLVRARWPQAAPLHRLGRATSGLVLFARTRAAAAALSTHWGTGEVEKRYRALASGRAREEQYEISAPIGLVPHPRLGEVYGATVHGKRSRSTARTLERRAASTLFEVRIHTGRPEQIRIHLAFIGHPLEGDPVFVAGGVPRADAPGLPGDGGYLLHAESLAFAHPCTGARVELRAPPPPQLLTASGG